MSILANYFKSVKINIFDKYQTILDKWNNAGKALIINKNKLYNINDQTIEKTEEEIVYTINDNSNYTQNKDKTTLPIIESNLQNYFSNVYEKNLFFKCSLKEEEIATSDLIFICVNTPSSKEPKIVDNFDVNYISSLISRGIQLSLDNVYSSLEFICDSILNTNKFNLIFKRRILIQKSTVQIETLKFIREFIVNYFKKNISILKRIIEEKLENYNDNNKNFIFVFDNEEEIEKFVDEYFLLVNVPEFLAEGSAIENLINPDRIIIGSIKDNKTSACAASAMKQLYTKWIPEDKIILVDSNTSELSKLISNAFLGQRISSINSITALCESTNSDINKLTVTVGSDSRIGKNFLKASMGFGGSCLKKDILSLVYILSSRNLDLEAQYWANVIILNEYQRLRVCNEIFKCYEKLKAKIDLINLKINDEELKINNFYLNKKIEDIQKGKLNETNLTKLKDLKVNVFGLSFKGNTNDVRGSNSVFLVNFLIKNNIKVNLFDPNVKKIDFENELKMYNEDISDETIKEFLSFYTEEIYYENYLYALNYDAINVFCNDHKEFKKINFDLKATNNNPKRDDYSKDSENEDRFIIDLYDVFSLEKLKATDFKIYKLGVVNQID